MLNYLANCCRDLQCGQVCQLKKVDQFVSLHMNTSFSSTQTCVQHRQSKESSFASIFYMNLIILHCSVVRGRLKLSTFKKAYRGYARRGGQVGGGEGLETTIQFFSKINI